MKSARERVLKQFSEAVCHGPMPARGRGKEFVISPSATAGAVIGEGRTCSAAWKAAAQALKRRMVTC